jgi:hypothetical protein
MFAGALAVTLVCGACGGAYVDAYGDEAAYVDAPPVAIESYPRYYYRGGYVYMVNGRVYRPYGNRWVVYRTPPAEVRLHINERGRTLRQR